MNTLAEKPVRKSAATSPAVRAHRARLARIRRAEDKADLAIAIKRCADLDSGKTKARKAEDVWRDLGV